MYPIESLPGREYHLNGRRWLFFSGTGYLGIHALPSFQEAFRQGVQRFGTGMGISRNNPLHCGLYDEAEAALAEQEGFEAAVTVSSGMLAGLLATHVLASEHAFVLDGTHPAICPPHAHRLPNLPQWDGSGILCANLVDNLYASAPNFSSIPHGATLLLDHAHSIGLHRVRDLVPANANITAVASLAKGMGLNGGIILGDAATIARIRRAPIFAGASPMPAAYLYAWMQCRQRYALARQRLFDHIRHFMAYTDRSEWQGWGGFPVFYSPRPHFQALFERGIFISSFAYPTADGPPLTRIVLNALHTEADIRTLCAVLKTFS